MTQVKLCGLSRECDIEAVNELLPEYIGFVFFEKSKRYVTPERAAVLKEKLDSRIKAVGVFVDETPEKVAELVNKGIIDIAQLHGSEDEDYIKALRSLCKAPIIRAFQIKNGDDFSINAEISEKIRAINDSTADFVLVDSGQGTGKPFNWQILQKIDRSFFLAGGINPDNLGQAITETKPFAVDMSSGIETDGLKDPAKMRKVVDIVRNSQEEARYDN